MRLRFCRTGEFHIYVRRKSQLRDPSLCFGRFCTKTPVLWLVAPPKASGVSVQQTWTGGDGSMTGTVIVTMIPYSDIGKIPVLRFYKLSTARSAKLPGLPFRLSMTQLRKVSSISSSRIRPRHKTPMRISCTTSNYAGKR